MEWRSRQPFIWIPQAGLVNFAVIFAVNIAVVPVEGKWFGKHYQTIRRLRKVSIPVEGKWFGKRSYNLCKNWLYQSFHPRWGEVVWKAWWIRSRRKSYPCFHPRWGEVVWKEGLKTTRTPKGKSFHPRWGEVVWKVASLTGAFGMFPSPLRGSGLESGKAAVGGVVYLFPSPLRGSGLESSKLAITVRFRIKFPSPLRGSGLESGGYYREQAECFHPLWGELIWKVLISH